MILIMVSIGGLTRLTHSGLSMIHWTFTGSLPPMNDVEWNIEFDKYKTSPEFVELHNHFALEDFKSIFWWEYIHRMFGAHDWIGIHLPFRLFHNQAENPDEVVATVFNYPWVRCFTGAF